MSKHRVKNREKKMRERITKSLMASSKLTTIERSQSTIIKDLQNEILRLNDELTKIRRKNQRLATTIYRFKRFAEHRGWVSDVSALECSANEDVVPEKIFVSDTDFRNILLD